MTGRIAPDARPRRRAGRPSNGRWPSRKPRTCRSGGCGRCRSSARSTCSTAAAPSCLTPGPPYRRRDRRVQHRRRARPAAGGRLRLPVRLRRVGQARPSRAGGRRAARHDRGPGEGAALPRRGPRDAAGARGHGGVPAAGRGAGAGEPVHHGVRLGRLPCHVRPGAGRPARGDRRVRPGRRHLAHAAAGGAGDVPRDMAARARRGRPIGRAAAELASTRRGNVDRGQARIAACSATPSAVLAAAAATATRRPRSRTPRTAEVGDGTLGHLSRLLAAGPGADRRLGRARALAGGRARRLHRQGLHRAGRLVPGAALPSPRPAGSTRSASRRAKPRSSG